MRSEHVFIVATSCAVVGGAIGYGLAYLRIAIRLMRLTLKKPELGPLMELAAEVDE